LGVLAGVSLMSIGAAASAVAAPEPVPSQPVVPSEPVPSEPAPSEPPSTSTGELPPRPDTAQGDGWWAPYPAGEIEPATVSGMIEAGGCRYQQANDRPHRSGGDVSIHGWWLRWSGQCPQKANVDAAIQAYWCDSIGCRFVAVDTGSGDYYGGGGSGRWAN